MKDFELHLIFPEIWETLATYQTLKSISIQQTQKNVNKKCAQKMCTAYFKDLENAFHSHDKRGVGVGGEGIKKKKKYQVCIWT